MIETDGPGGAERMVAALAAAFAEAGCSTVAVLPASGEGWLAGQLAGTGVEIDHVDLRGRISPRHVRDLVRVLRKHRIDLVHSHEFTMSVFGSAAARLARVPHVITLHGTRYHTTALHRRLAMGVAVRASRGVVGVSDSVARQLRTDLRLPDRLVSVIPNGVRPPARVAGTLRSELGLGPDVRLLVAVGNLYPVKGHADLVAALAQVGPGVPETHLAIAGRGELREPLRQQAESLGLGSRVHLLGYRSDIANLLASADLFVLPSRSEGLPLALLEAMFAGCAIVATDVGEVAAVLGDDAGIVVPPGDVAALAGALRRLLADPDEAARLGRAAERRAAEHYDLSVAVERYAALYSTRLDSAGRR